jgi:hypothetical protein
VTCLPPDYKNFIEKLVDPRCTPPRYDDVYYQGMEWLNKIASGEIPDGY